MFETCWRYGIKVMPLAPPFVDNSFDYDYQSIKHLKAFSVPKSVGRRGTIFIKEDLDHIEKKLLLAEEFCHIYSHYSSQLTTSKYHINKTEQQAKKMSAYLLMPEMFLDAIYHTAIDEAVLISEVARN